MDYLRKIYDKLTQEELNIVGTIKDLPGEWQRFTSLKKNKPNVYIYIYPSRKSALIGDWSINDKPIYVRLHSKPLTQEEHDQIKIIEEKKILFQIEAIKKCTSIWNACIEPDIEHPYIVKKQIYPYYIRQLGNYLICPLYNEFSDLVGLQGIYLDGSKRFINGSIIKSSFLILGDKRTKIIRLVEGYATGMSIHMATDDLTIVAFTCSNLQNVALILKKLFPNHIIIICTDAKIQEIEYAARAARAIDCIIKCPLSDVGSLLDFNDIHVLYGLEALQGQLYSDSFKYP